MVGNGTVGRQEALSVAGGLEPLHAPFTLTRRPMRVLTPVVEIAALTMLDPRQNLALGRTVAPQLIGDHHPRHTGEALEQLAEELRVTAWLEGRPQAKTRTSRFAILAPPHTLGPG